MIELDFDGVRNSNGNQRDNILRDAIDASFRSCGRIDEFFIISYLIGRIVPDGACDKRARLSVTGSLRDQSGFRCDPGSNN
ncbi:MAG TPA: hypothetical protein VIS48_16905 [Candidatus Kryptonia bacterium]